VKVYASGAALAPIYDSAAGILIANLTSVPQGNAGSQRVGDHLFMQNITLRMYFQNGQGANSNIGTTWRYLVFQYIADSSVAGKPAITDILNSSAANFGNTYGTHSTFDVDYQRNYIVLYDSGPFSTYGSQGVATSGSSSFMQTLGRMTRVPLTRANRNVSFQAGTTNGFYNCFLAVMTDQQTIATNPEMAYSCELQFTDS
jgi:hypothetical protein